MTDKEKTKALMALIRKFYNDESMSREELLTMAVAIDRSDLTSVRPTLATTGV